jgi:hypothetical protein
MRLLARMIDSNLVQSQDYEIYFSKFLMEAKQELRKQAINEKKKMIKKATDKNSTDEDDDDDSDHGNEKLGMYAKLILPFWKTNPSVAALFQQLLQSTDKKVKYSTMLLMIRNDKSVPDSLLNYFAGMDDYRYNLYDDLQEMGQLSHFPTKYNNKVDLAKGKLFDSRSYDEPDSVVYLDKLPVEVKSKQGFIYFFKYKDKKDDMAWKLASVGLIARDPKQFDLINESISPTTSDDNPFDFTLFTDSKIKADVPVHEQLDTALKKLLHSHRKSAKEFYDVSKNDLDEILKLKN